MFRKVLWFTIATCTICTAAQAKDLYVSTTGNDSVSYANNSSSSPWRTPGRAIWGSTNRGSPNAAEAARGGDTVIVLPGTYDTNAGTGRRYDPIYNPANSGSSGAPLVIKAQTAGSVYLRSSQSSQRQPLIGTFERNFVTWDGFVLEEQYIPTTADTGPVVGWNSNDITFQNLTIVGYDYGWADNHNGIRLEFTDRATVRNNRISNYNGTGPGMNGSGITTYYSKTVLVENNEIYACTTGIFIKGAMEGPVTVRKNLVRDVGTFGIVLGGMGLETGSNGARVYSNIVYNSPYAGIALIGYNTWSPANVTIANNTVYNVNPSSDGAAVLYRREWSGYRNIRVFNNILARSRAGVFSEENQLSQVTSNYNMFYANSTSVDIGYHGYALSLWQSTFGKDQSGSLEANPAFVNESGRDFHLQAGSPALGAGLDVLDLNGNGSTTDRVNMGAYALGNEVIGRTTAVAAIRPNPPTGVTVQ